MYLDLRSDISGGKYSVTKQAGWLVSFNDRNTKDGGRRLGFASRRECNCCERIPLSPRLLLASPNAQCFWSRKTCLLCLDACRNKGWQLPSASQITPVRITEIEVDDKCQTNFLSIEMYCLEDMPSWWTCQPPSFTVWHVLLLGQPGTFSGR